ncbi:MAG TPA: hypothetical protein VI643_02640 [Planctomycetota bacterium]|nr:hypothetical protein [Planctomycetota bacterium]
MSPNGRYLLLNSGETIYDMKEGRRTGSAGYGVKAAISSDSRAMFVYAEGVLRKIELATGRELASRQLEADAEGAHWKEVSPDGRTLALAVGGGRVLLVDTSTLALRKTLQVEAEETIVVAFGQRGRSLVVLAGSGRVFHFGGR